MKILRINRMLILRGQGQIVRCLFCVVCCLSIPSFFFFFIPLPYLGAEEYLNDSKWVSSWLPRETMFIVAGWTNPSGPGFHYLTSRRGICELIDRGIRRSRKRENIRMERCLRRRYDPRRARTTRPLCDGAIQAFRYSPVTSPLPLQ